MSIEEIQKGIDAIIGDMEGISLSEMSNIKLMNRTDTKYVVSIDILLQLLTKAKDDYWVQDNESIRRAYYQTVYFDTQNMQMYNAHQEGQKVREKIRIRTYVGSDLSFLEVKNKTSRGRTVKHRIKIKNINTLNEDGAEELLKKHAWYKLKEVAPKIENQFRRITLVNKARTERLTIDTDIIFHNLVNDVTNGLPLVAVVELKRDDRTSSPMINILNELQICQVGFSKYCIGCAMTDNSLKRNRIKYKLRKIEKMNKIS